MKTSHRRLALLTGGSVTALGLTMVAATPAYAACTFTGGNTLVCTNTTTFDTTGVGPTDRNYVYTGAGTGTVGTGVVVNGFGLAMTDAGAGTSLAFTNNGTIQVDAGTPTQGGNGALSLTALTGPVTYTGTGDILNLGNGVGLDVNLSGTASFTGTVGGNVTSGLGGSGIEVFHTGTAGNMAVTTTAGKTIQSDFVGIFLNSTGAYTGTETITNNAAIASRTGFPNTLDY
ncbi:MAG: hypothetical protein ACJ8D5_06815, partial [Sphingomicrobium sp.]